MPLNTQIALQTTTPQARSPIQTLGALAQLRQQDDLNQQHTLANEQRRRELEDDSAIRETLQRTGSPDTAIDELYKGGRAEAAGVLSKSVYEHRKAKAEETKRTLENQDKQLTFATQIFQGVTDQASLDTARKAAAVIVPDLIQYVPQEYDPKKVAQVVDWGTSRAEHLKSQQDAIANANKAWDLSLQQAKDWRERDKNNRDAREYWTQAASALMPTSTSQEEWDAHQALLANSGAPLDLLAEYGNQYTPAAVENAKKLAMKPTDVAAVAHQKVEETQGQQNIGLRTREVAVREEEAGLGKRGQALTPNKIADVNRWKANEYQKLEADMRKDPNFTDPGTGALSLDDNAKAEIGKRKLEIENGARAQMGEAPLFQAEHDLAGDPAKGKELRKVRNTIKALTGDEAPLERMEKLADALKKEKDPSKVTALRQQLAAMRQQYGELVGR